MITVKGQPGGAGGAAPPATWGDSPARVVTVWGLGVGLAVVGAFVMAAAWHLTGNFAVTLAITLLIVGATGGGSAFYLDYMKRHMRLSAAWKSPAARAVSSVVTLLVLFVSAFLISVLMLPILLVSIPSVRAKQRREATWRERADLFVSEMLPRIAVF